MANNETPATLPGACVKCNAVVDDPKTCSSCLAVIYCGGDCQKAAWKMHKRLCARIRQQRQLVSTLEAQLRKKKSDEFFEDQQGAFWAFSEAREYCCALQALGLDLVKMGENEDNLKAFEEAEIVYLELLRLTHRDNQGIRALFPFVLLALNRMQDAYGFIKWWATIDQKGSYDWNKGPKLTKGQWLYPRNEDIRGDILNVKGLLCDGECQTSTMDPFHHMAMIFIKLKIIKDLIAERNQAGEARMTTIKRNIKGQETQLARLVRSLQGRSSYALMALLLNGNHLNADVLEARVLVANTVQEGFAIKMTAMYVFKKIGGQNILNSLVATFPMKKEDPRIRDEYPLRFCVHPPLACIPLRFSPLVPQRYLEPALFGGLELLRCAACDKESADSIKCPQCQLSMFCNEACQLQAKARHGGLCKKLVSAKKRVERDVKELEQKMGRNYIQKNIGSLWQASARARQYCRSEQYVALAYKDLAEAERNQLAFDAAEKQYSELLRFTRDDLQGSRFVYAFILLAQERFQDCYDFVKWFMVLTADMKEYPKRLGKGDWTYFRGEDIMEDLRMDRRLPVCECGLPSFIESILLMALILLKMMIMEELKEGRLIKLGAPQEMWIKSVHPKLFQPYMIKKQEKILHIYATTLQKHCPSALSIVVDAKKILASQGSPDSYYKGTEEEARVIASLSNFVVTKFGLRSKITELLKTIPTFTSEQLDDNRCCPPVTVGIAEGFNVIVRMTAHSPLVPYETPMEDSGVMTDLNSMMAQQMKL